MPDFSRRATTPELMDTEVVDFDDFRICLSHLALVNRLTLAYRPTLQWLNLMAARLAGKGALSVVDVGSGYGDMLRLVARWARRRGIAVELTGVDLNPWSARAAAAATPADMRIQYVTADLFDYRPARPPDIILSSLFAHHLPDPALVRFIAWMEATARRGWFINDLRRDPLAYRLFALGTAFGGWHRFIRHDGLISITRSFDEADWTRLLRKAEVPDGAAEVVRRFPYRLCVGRLRG